MARVVSKIGIYFLRYFVLISTNLIISLCAEFFLLTNSYLWYMLRYVFKKRVGLDVPELFSITNGITTINT